MSLPVGSPALGLLLRLKLRGLARHQWRRLKTPKGLVLTLLGGGAFALWIGSLAFSLTRPPTPLVGANAEMHVRAFGLMLLLLSLSTALTNRGLYLPRNEIERLFSAPVSRADLVRYRLVAGGIRSLLGGMVLGLFGARRMSSPTLAFIGIVLAMQTLPVVNQLVAIALGGLERRAAQALRRVGMFLLVVVLGVLSALVFTLATGRPVESVPLIGPMLGGAVAVEGDFLAHPWLGRVTVPFVPWAKMIGAPSLVAFLPWLLACLGLHFALAELCARLPIDYRELSLSTSARVARRVARARRGGGVAATRASESSAGWRIPWLFGRGPAGAIAWRKCAGLARKAKGAFWVALIALLFITLFAGLVLDGDGEQEALARPILIAVMGTIYLCSGLRFDFREELERMDVIRAWPLAPAQVFAATLLPEVVLVSILVMSTVLLQAVLGGAVTLHVLGVVACLPFLVLAWTALDNIVFLFAPVRHVPGQDGFVQNAGRRMIQMVLLALLAALLGFFGALAFWVATWLVGVLGGGVSASLAAGFAALLLVLALGDAALILWGGAVLRRFDVARDRG